MDRRRRLFALCSSLLVVHSISLLQSFCSLSGHGRCSIWWRWSMLDASLFQRRVSISVPCLVYNLWVSDWFCEYFLVLSFFDNKYAEHSVFYYWKSILLCGSIKAVQLYLWIAALSSCGPFICVLFEQSPKILFVAVGLIANTYSSNRSDFEVVWWVGLLYFIGIAITLGGYMISLFGLPQLPIGISASLLWCRNPRFGLQVAERFATCGDNPAIEGSGLCGGFKLHFPSSFP